MLRSTAESRLTPLPLYQDSSIPLFTVLLRRGNGSCLDWAKYPASWHRCLQQGSATETVMAPPQVKRLRFREGNTGKMCQKKNSLFLCVQWQMYVPPELIWPMTTVFPAASTNEFPLWINASSISLLKLERHWALQTLHKETIQGTSRCSVSKQLEHR